jgi:hypothetical protein
MRSRTKPALAAALTTVAAATLAGSLVGATPALASSSGLGSFHTISTVASTVPANGDVNPYGVAVVPRSIGALHRGDVLVSNFNNSANLQGTGSTIVEITPSGHVSTFATISSSTPVPGGIGLTTALTVLRSGWVIVGSLPTKDGMPDTIGAGGLIVLDSHGNVRAVISGAPINGPWDMTALDRGDEAMLFVTNVLNGTVAANGQVVHRGTVVRIDLSIPDRGMPRVVSETVIGSGFGERTDPSALVVGPTGVALHDGTLFVADTVASRITAIGDAIDRGHSDGVGRVVSAGHDLMGSLGLAAEPDGRLLTVNGGNGDIAEVARDGQQIAEKTLDSTGNPPGAGTLFGLAVARGGVYFVDDGSNTLNLLH